MNAAGWIQADIRQDLAMLVVLKEVHFRGHWNTRLRALQISRPVQQQCKILRQVCAFQSGQTAVDHDKVGSKRRLLQTADLRRTAAEPRAACSTDPTELLTFLSRDRRKRH